MGKTKKLIRNFIIFLILIFITFYFVLRGQNFNQLTEMINTANGKFLIVAVVCMFFYFCCEASNLGRTLKALGEKSNFWKNLKYSFIGYFFSAITPAASGGQPMQVYFMYKDKISMGNSTLALVLNLLCMQIVTLSIALISAIFHWQNMNPGTKLLFMIGVLLNIGALSMLLIAIFSDKLLDKIYYFLIKIMKKLRFRKIEEKELKLKNEIERYKESAKYIKENKEVLFKNLLIAYIQFIVYYTVVYWIYCSMNMNTGYNIVQLTTLQSVAFAAVSSIPLPGSVGASEGAFLSLFGKAFPGEYLKGALVLSRGIGFYLFVIISFLVVVYSSFNFKAIYINKKSDIIDKHFNKNKEGKRL